MLYIFCILMIIISGIYFYRLIKKPIKINFDFEYSSWFMPSIYMFTSVMIFFYLGIAIEDYFRRSNTDNYWTILYNGFYILVSCLIVARCMRRTIKANYLDYSKRYNTNLIKILFSVSVIANCIVYSILLLCSNEFSNDKHCVVNNIVVWFATVVGTWMDVAYKCEGRIEEEKRLRDKIEEADKENINDDAKNVIIDKKYYTSFILGALLIVVMWALTLFIFFRLLSPKLFFGSGITFVVSFTLMAAIYGGIMFPSEDSSNNRLLRRIEKYKKGKKGKSSYRRLRYEFKDNNLIIYGKEVEYDKHVDEVNDLFGTKVVPVKIDDIDSIKEILHDRNIEQDAFIENHIYEERENKRKELVGLMN